METVQPGETRNPLVLITGGSSGIGFAIAREFARRRHEVLLVARNLSRLEIVADKLRSETGAKVDVLVLDLAQPQVGNRLASHVSELKRPIGILVNNAGVFAAGSMADAGADELAAMLAVNISAPLAMIGAVLPSMRENGYGRILNIGSLAGLSPTPAFASYGASKAFLHSSTLALREELRGTGISVSLLAAGLVRTDFVTRGTTSRLTSLAYRVATRPETVALCAYRGLMAGDAIIVPGLSARLLWYGMRLAPTTLRTRITAAFAALADAGLPTAARRTVPAEATATSTRGSNRAGS